MRETIIYNQICKKLTIIEKIKLRDILDTKWWRKFAYCKKDGMFYLWTKRRGFWILINAIDLFTFNRTISTVANLQ